MLQSWVVGSTSRLWLAHQEAHLYGVMPRAPGPLRHTCMVHTAASAQRRDGVSKQGAFLSPAQDGCMLSTRRGHTTDASSTAMTRRQAYVMHASLDTSTVRHALQAPSGSCLTEQSELLHPMNRHGLQARKPGDLWRCVTSFCPAGIHAGPKWVQITTQPCRLHRW